MKKMINSKLFVLYSIRHCIESRLRSDERRKNGKQRVFEVSPEFAESQKKKFETDLLYRAEIERQQEGYISSEFFGVEPHTALIHIQDFLKKGVIGKLFVSQCDAGERERIKVNSFTAEDVEDYFTFSLIPYQLLKNEDFAWSFEMKPAQEDIQEEISKELEVWENGVGRYSQNYKYEKQIEEVMAYLEKVSQDFPPQNIPFYYKIDAFPFTDALAVLLSLEQECVCTVKNVRMLFGEDYEPSPNFSISLELLPMFFEKVGVEAETEQNKLIFKDGCLSYNGKEHCYKKGHKRAFCEAMFESDRATISRKMVSESIFEKEGQESRLKSLVGKVNMDMKEYLKIETVFSLEGAFIRKNY